MEGESRVLRRKDTNLRPLLLTKVIHIVFLQIIATRFDYLLHRETDGRSSWNADDYDVIGTLPGFEKLVEAESSKQSKGKLVNGSEQ